MYEWKKNECKNRYNLKKLSLTVWWDAITSIKLKSTKYPKFLQLKYKNIEIWNMKIGTELCMKLRKKIEIIKWLDLESSFIS